MKLKLQEGNGLAIQAFGFCNLGFSVKLGAWDLSLCKWVTHNGYCVAVSANQYSPM
jgi:hypothetical protein